MVVLQECHCCTDNFCHPLFDQDSEQETSLALQDGGGNGNNRDCSSMKWEQGVCALCEVFCGLQKVHAFANKMGCHYVFVIDHV